jgi:hypothetical protein
VLLTDVSMLTVGRGIAVSYGLDIALLVHHYFLVVYVLPHVAFHFRPNGSMQLG